MNKFIGIGRNTKDGELRTTSNDIKVFSNTIAITNNFKNKEGNYDSEFINYSAYRTTAEYLSKYSKKGTLICLEGRIHTSSYEDKDKIKRYSTELIVENAKVLERTQESQTTQNATQDTTQDVPQNITSNYDDDSAIVLSDDDLPF